MHQHVWSSFASKIEIRGRCANVIATNLFIPKLWIHLAMMTFEFSSLSVQLLYEHLQMICSLISRTSAGFSVTLKINILSAALSRNLRQPCDRRRASAAPWRREVGEQPFPYCTDVLGLSLESSLCTQIPFLSFASLRLHSPLPRLPLPSPPPQLHTTEHAARSSHSLASQTPRNLAVVSREHPDTNAHASRFARRRRRSVKANAESRQGWTQHLARSNPTQGKSLLFIKTTDKSVM